MSGSTATSWWRPGELHLQGTLFGFTEPTIDTSFAGLRRRALGPASWVDHQPGWLTGDQVLFDRLVLGLGRGAGGWQHRTVVVRDHLVGEPRLTASWHAGDGPEPLPILAAMRRALGRRYHEPFDAIGFNCYRRGDDSLGWHGDRGDATDDLLVAIVSIGAPRPFRLRPRGGGPSIGLELGNGDLLVMGGACQQDWEHSVPKVRHAEPRISIAFRPACAMAQPASRRRSR